MMETFFTLKLESESGSIKEIIKDGIRIAKLMSINVETAINGVEVHMHPLSDPDEVYEEYKTDGS
jgi:hypothetical protein